jgi:tripeptide aminopeptidase
VHTSALERFLRYVIVDTRSDERASTFPSTPGQLTLLRQLVDELKALGIDDASMDEHGYVMATIPATSPGAIPVIGFVAHVDTSPEMPGAGVRPIVHRQYDGRDIALPDDPTAVLRVSEHPVLAAQIGNDIVTASGTTLLGADDKAGVAAIMAAAEYLMGHPAVPHGPVRIAFTPDEEIGRGANHFDVARFAAVCAYTLDGGKLLSRCHDRCVPWVQYPSRLRKGPHGQCDPARRRFHRAPAAGSAVAGNDRRVRRLRSSLRRRRVSRAHVGQGAHP